MKTPILILLTSIATTFAQVSEAPKPPKDPFAADPVVLINSRLAEAEKKLISTNAQIDAAKARLAILAKSAEHGGAADGATRSALTKALESATATAVTLEQEIIGLRTDRDHATGGSAPKAKTVELRDPFASGGFAPKAKPAAAIPQCDVDLKKTGQMKDVLSNVLMRAEHKPEPEVQAFLKDAVKRSATGDDLLKAAAEHFKIDQKRLAALVEQWRHVNCKHAAIPSAAADPFVKDGTGTQALTGENTYTGPWNCQVLFETFDLSREDFLALLDEKGDDDVRYRRVAEWMAAGRAKLTTFTALTARSGQRSKVEAIDEVRYATEFRPPISADDIASPSDFQIKNAGESLELELQVAEDGQSAVVNLAPSSVTLLNFVDVLAEPDKANSATSQPRFATRSLTTNVQAQIGRPRLIGTLSGASEQGGVPAVVRVAFLTFRRATLPKPKPEALVKDATQARLEYTFFSLDRGAARDLYLAKPEPQACYDGLRAFVGEKKAHLEHLSINVTRWGQQTRMEEIQEVAYATHWTYSNRDARPATPAVGTNFEIKNAGFSSHVEPILSEDGATADLNLALEFVRYAGNLQVTGIAKKYPPQPLFQTSKVTNQVYMTVGEQQLIGTFNTPAESGANGRQDDGQVWFGFVRAVLVK